jgi:hypothetical protein
MGSPRERTVQLQSMTLGLVALQQCTGGCVVVTERETILVRHSYPETKSMSCRK